MVRTYTENEIKGQKHDLRGSRSRGRGHDLVVSIVAHNHAKRSNHGRDGISEQFRTLQNQMEGEGKSEHQGRSRDEKGHNILKDDL